MALQEEVVVQLVEAQRRYMPRVGGKKLYHLIKADLSKLQNAPGRDKFFDILRSRGLLVARKKKYVYTTDSFHRFRVYKNLLKGKELSAAHQAWVCDITYLRTLEGFVYLFLLSDAYSRKITGWCLSGSLAIEGALSALKMALRQCPHPKGVIHHSDRGIQYCCKDYVALLKKARMLISMTEENHCYENSMAERINGILKDEFLLDEEFKDFRTAQSAAQQAIETYNTRRPHWALKLRTPQQVHQQAA
jgi:putative transposase